MDFILRISWSPGIAMEYLKRKKGGSNKKKRGAELLERESRNLSPERVGTDCTCAQKQAFANKIRNCCC